MKTLVFLSNQSCFQHFKMRELKDILTINDANCTKTSIYYSALHNTSVCLLLSQLQVTPPNKINQMIQRLNQILTQKTVSLQVKCILDETVIDRNFTLIIQCLKDYAHKQSQMQDKINQLYQKNHKIHKQLELTKTNTHINGFLSQQNIKADLEQDKHDPDPPSSRSSKKRKISCNDKEAKTVDQNDIRELVKEISDQLQKQSELNKKNNLENIKDINILLKDIKEVKQRIGVLQEKNKENTSIKQSDAIQTKDMSIENIRILQNQLHKQSQKMDKLQSEVDKVKNKNSNILEKIKAFQNNSGVTPTTLTNEDEDSLQKKFDSLKADIQKIIQKVNQNQSKQRDDTRGLTLRLQNVDIGIKELQNRVSNNQSDIQSIKQKLQNLIQSVVDLQNNNSNYNSEKQIQKLQKQLKRLEQQFKKDANKIDQWRRKMDENIKQHTLNISDIQAQLADFDAFISGLERDKDRINMSTKNLQDKNKLPSLGGKKSLKLKSISRQDSVQKSTGDIDKKLQELKSDIQQWVRQLLQARGMTNQDSSKKKDEFVDGLQLKMQEIKIILERKADNEGVKKYLSFLDNKINQIWAILSQPDTEDALIARKGWNCLSCAKKLQKYKGKIGQHVNWNNLTTTNYSPPRVGYSQSVSHNTTQNISIPASKNRGYGMEGDTNTRQFP